MAYGFLGENPAPCCWSLVIATFVLSTSFIGAGFMRTCCWGISCLLGQTWGHGNDCLYTSWLLDLRVSASLLSFLPLILSSSLLLSLQFLFRAVTLLNHCSIELGWFSASINFLLIVVFILLLNSSINGCSLYLLSLATLLKSYTNSFIFLPPYSILFNFATFVASLSPLPNFFLISNKNSPADSYSTSPVSNSFMMFFF